ncbi:MAG: SGNH/GDSL hydrolase family protein, partial [Anaerolineae bacterium]
TQHGPREEIGWIHDWGMAATSQNRDWVHLLLAQMPGNTELTLVHCTAPNLPQKVGDLEARIQSAQASVVVIQIGDNLNAGDATDETLRKPVARLLQAADARSAKVVVGVWGGDDVRDQLLEQAAEDAGALFVPIHDLANQPGHRAWEQGVFDEPAVGWHPSDLGMAAIADRVADALGYE